eukprot:COSAG01_NODE_2137_length_8329_cov_52.487242_13_plen_72_part_00
MAAGSVLLWLGSTLHGAAATTGSSIIESSRKGLLLIYNQGWLKSEHNFHFCIPLSVQRGFPRTLQDLVGLT